MSNTSKADQLRALREANHSAARSGVVKGKPQKAVGPKTTDDRTRSGAAPVPAVAPSKKKRAPAGTFDKVAYQRDYMRKRRAAIAKAKTHKD